jgi:uncharacterized protein (DUF58 family)
MLLIWIPVSVLAMYLILNMVYGKLWKKGLKAQLRFEERDVEEGDNATLVETMTNDKFLPIPVLTLSFKVDRSIEIDEDRNATVSDKTNVVEYFGLGAHEVITRRQPVKAAKRGYYLIDEAGITLPDFFSESVRYMNIEQAASLLVCPRMLDGNEIIDISRQIIGDVIARSRLYQDVFSFRGIREYTPADPLNAVNWKASARTGDYMVNIRDYTCGQHVRFLLDLEPPSIRYREELLEQEIRLAYTLAGRCIWENIPVSLASNGRDVITGKEVEILSGSSERHLGSIGEMLARVNLSLKPGPFWELIRQERLGMSSQPSGEDIAFCLISSGQSDALLKEAEALSQQCGGLFWICILDPEVERKPIPAGIHFVPVQY